MGKGHMTITVTHAFVSGKTDNADPTEVNPSNWNAQHTLTLATNNILGRASAGTGQVEEVPCTAVARTLLAASTQLAMRAAMGQSLTADIGAQQVTGALIANGTITATQLAGITAQSMAVSALGVNAPVNAGLTAGVSGGNLTITLTDNASGTPSLTSPVDIVFRDATSNLPALGVPVLRQVTSALSLVIPSGATMGVTVNGTPFRGWLVTIDNSGTVELGAIVCGALVSGAATVSGAINNEGALIGATAISGTSTLPGVVYATTGVSSKAFRIIGYFEYSAGLASAGVYSIAPTTLKLFGPGDKKPGDIIQVTSVSSTTVATTNSATFVALTNGTTLSFTPVSTCNLVKITSTGVIETAGGIAFVQLARGSTLLGNPITCPASLGVTGIPGALCAYDQAPSGASTYGYQGKAAGGVTMSYPPANTGVLLEVVEVMA